MKKKRSAATDSAPSDREMEILKALWQLCEGSVRQVLDVVAPDGELAFNTIQTQLRIMEDKKLVSHRTDGRSFIYRPLYSRDSASSRFLEKVFDGAVGDLVMTLLNSQQIPADELQKLERLIAQARKQSKAKIERPGSGKGKS